MYIIR